MLVSGYWVLDSGYWNLVLKLFPSGQGLFPFRG